MERKTKKFRLDDAPVLAENERILESGNKKQETPVVNNAMVSAPVPEAVMPKAETPKAKTENGIVVNVPMDDYIQLSMMKIRTGRTLKDLALQAIHEFVAHAQ